MAFLHNPKVQVCFFLKTLPILGLFYRLSSRAKRRVLFISAWKLIFPLILLQLSQQNICGCLDQLSFSHHFFLSRYLCISEVSIRQKSQTLYGGYA